MSSAETSDLIDRIAKLLSPHLGRNEDATDKVATEIVGDLQSRFYLIPIPTVGEEAQTRSDLVSMEIPGLFSTSATKGPQ